MIQKVLFSYCNLEGYTTGRVQDHDGEPRDIQDFNE